jgi:hypothetical protein
MQRVRFEIAALAQATCMPIFKRSKIFFLLLPTQNFKSKNSTFAICQADKKISRFANLIKRFFTKFVPSFFAACSLSACRTTHFKTSRNRLGVGIIIANLCK